MKEKYTVKAVFTDIDGTLLNCDHIVTEPTRNAIHKITDNNILFTWHLPEVLLGLNLS